MYARLSGRLLVWPARYAFQFMAKGGGSANKTFLFQRTKALLNEKALEKVRPNGTTFTLTLTLRGLTLSLRGLRKWASDKMALLSLL